MRPKPLPCYLVLFFGCLVNLPLTQAQTHTGWECVEVEGEWACYPQQMEIPPYQLPYDPERIQPEQSSTNARAQALGQLDWVPRSALPPEQAAACPRGCEGGYLAPQRQDEDRLQNPAESQLNAEAGLSELNGETGQAILTGSVVFTQGWRQAAADRVVIDRSQNLYQMEGNITIREPGLLLTGESARVDSDTGELQLQQAQYLLHDLRVQGSAEEIRRGENGHIYIDNATYSTCEPINQEWHLNAEQIEIDPEGARILARNMKIRAGGLTLFYAPRISLPLGDERKSGLLYPILESSGDNGLDLAQPIYLNLAPQYDLSLTPRWIEERGAMLESQFRWLNPGGDGSIEGAYLDSDGGGDSGSQQGEQRWFGQILAQQETLAGQLKLDYSAASDQDYFADLGNASLQSSSQTWLQRSFSYRVSGRLVTLDLSATSYQDLTDDELLGFSELPRLQITSSWQSGANWYLDTLHEGVVFRPLNKETTPASPLQRDTRGDWVAGERYRLAYRSGWRSKGPAHYADFAVLGNYLAYRLDRPLEGSSHSSPGLTAGGGLLEARVAFERNSRIFGLNWTQTLEPRLQYLYMEAESQSDQPLFDSFAPRTSYQNIFRTNTFGGGDRIADANRVTLGVETAMLSVISGRELARLGVAQQFHLQDRTVHASPRLAAGLTDPSDYAMDDPDRLAAITGRRELQELQSRRSPITSFLQVNLPQSWYSRMLLNWSEIDDEIDFGTFELGYRSPDNGTLVNLAYHYDQAGPVFRDANSDGLVQRGEAVDGTVEQLDLSAVIEYGDHWTLIGKWQQDVSHLRPLEVLAGARYDSCCWSATLVWRHWLERNDNLLVPEQALRHDNGIFVSFELKGLAGVGERLENILSGSIPGY